LRVKNSHIFCASNLRTTAASLHSATDSFPRLYVEILAGRDAPGYKRGGVATAHRDSRPQSGHTLRDT
jgi:hypothetical protein